MTTVDLLLPRPAQLTPVAAVLVVALLMIGLGRLVAGARRPAFALLAGWGLCVFVVVLAGTTTTLSLRLVVGFLAIGGIAGLFLLLRRGIEEQAAWGRAGRILVLALPLILLVAGMRASQWDELAQWLPNAHFLVDHDRFPSAALPNTGSFLPAYPYGLPLVIYFASLLSGGLAERSGMIFSVVLLLAASAAIADLIADHRNSAAPPAEISRWSGWGVAAAGLIVAAPLNPSFVPKLVFTNYTDNPTSCALAIAALAAVAWVEAASALRPERYRLAFACGCVLAAIAGLRQANLVLVLLLCGGVAVALLIEGTLFDRRFLSGLLALPMPLATTLVWQSYAASAIPNGALKPMSFADWHFDLLEEISGSMLRVAASKGGHFGLMAAILLLACATLVRPQLVDATARRLCGIAAVVFVGYTAFLLLAYIGIFTDYEATRAASFWRYSTHLGLLGVVAAVAVALPRWRLRPAIQRGLTAVAVAVLLAVPAATAKRLRFDLDHPHDGYIMAVAREMRPLLPPGARVALFDLDGSGSDLILMRYEVLFGKPSWDASQPHGAVTLHSGGDFAPALRSLGAGIHVWVEEGGPETRSLFGLDLASGASYLLVRDSDGFRLLHAWPITPETDVFMPRDLE
jgi:hypothetical protein